MKHPVLLGQYSCYAINSVEYTLYICFQPRLIWNITLKDRRELIALVAYADVTNSTGYKINMVYIFAHLPCCLSMIVSVSFAHGTRQSALWL